MKKQLLTFGALILMSAAASSQTIWQENFESYADGTGVVGDNGTPIGDYPSGVTKWVLDLSGAVLDNNEFDYVRVNTSGSVTHLETRDTDGEARITFQSVDLSSQTGDVTIRIDDLDFNVFTNTNAWFNPGYLDVEYSLDGGSTFTRVANYNSEGNGDHTFYRETTDPGDKDINDIEIVIPNATIGSATSIIVKFRMRTDGSNQEVEVDDVEIIRNGATLFLEDFNSYAIPTGIVGTDSQLSDEVGDYASVTKWSLTLKDPEQLLNSFDFARTTLAESTNGTLTLLFNDVNDDLTFETETIDITGKSQITFGMDLMLTSTTYEANDYFDVYYSTDNGTTYTLAKDNGTGHTFSGTNNISAGTVKFSETLSGLSATQLKLRFVARNDSNTEDFEVDNIKVVEGSTLSVASNELVGVKMYPNPVKNNIINITSSSIKNLPITITIYDVTGKSFFNTKTTNSTVSLPNLPKGIYIVKLIQEGKSAVKKLIIQ